jgi:hypothetical protein
MRAGCVSTSKARIISEDIAAGKLCEWRGKYSGYCDFLPVCLGDKKKVQETLLKIT